MYDFKSGFSTKDQSLSKAVSSFANTQGGFIIFGIKDIKSYLIRHDTSYEETDDLERALPRADVVYWPRIQKERFNGAVVAKSLVIGKDQLKLLKSDAILMSPLPRIDEISQEVDTDPRAVYFKQAGNGMFVRMALIEWTVGLL